ncbi:MAG: DEAD/DEAH box helicase [Lachnospiraceae bacterium]|nr:DEAD/DEAH box helicase [Lachnospiraceae bacterium]
MNEEIITQIQQGMRTAFIDTETMSNLAYKPQFISNNYKSGRKVLATIEEELCACDEFSISVAFITMSGITPLLQTLKELEKKGVPGRIMTTDYLMFSEPKALDKLAELSNIQLKMYLTDKAGEGFHTKGYIFRDDEIYRIIVGSSNMTLNALTKNKEWNARLISTEQGEYTQQILEEYEELWNSNNSVGYKDFIDNYRIYYEVTKKQKAIARQSKITSIEQYSLQPNKMQIGFISSLQKLKENQARRALLISATGTGKTYASAFALREENVRKVLFLVHREQIAKQAISSYQKVFGTTRTFGLLSGNSKNFEADYLFATMQMMAKVETLERFKKDEFDTIVIDEVHRAGAESYQRIIQYFQPQFWLGMTASPERTDDFDIYKLFDHNIAYEIRLQQALEENLLCPFHYFGITDLEIDGEVFDDNAGVRNFANLVCDARVDYIIKQAEYYGYSGERVKGLIFCSRQNEAKELSDKFNKRGYRTEFLSGDTSQQKREECIERLTSDANDNALDYIFTVDIFNEGVDIPEINQVIMLRPTESPIVFIQQLGRGLRKAVDKEYVVILDFIGNYMNNFMIPIALSGDRSYNKDTIRRYVRESARIIPGSSSVHFDEISKKRIFQSIDKATTTKKMLTEKYQALKYRLGRIPTILDFYEYGEIDPMLFVDYAKTYDNFVRMVDKDYTVAFSEKEAATLEFISSLVLNGKRPHELIMLQMLLEQQTIDKDTFTKRLTEEGEKFKEADFLSAIRVLTKDFLNTQSEKKRYSTVELFEPEETMKHHFHERIIPFYQKILREPYKQELQNLINYGLKKYRNCYNKHDEDNLVLYEKYSRKDICRILNWEKDDSSTLYGYRIKYNTCPIFVTYEKKEDIANSTKYEDQFINDQIFSWMTRSKVSSNSPETQELIHYAENDLKIFLFIKKSDGEGSDFYYMGRVTPFSWRETTILNDKGNSLPIMNFQMKLEHSVRGDIYEYFTK